MPDRATVVSLLRAAGGTLRPDQDLIAVEAPLAIEIEPGDFSLGVFMRTPGDDEDFVRGLLFSEGLVTSMADVASVSISTDGDGVERARVVVSRLAALPAARQTIGSSACGMCGRLAVQTAARRGGASSSSQPWLTPQIVESLPQTLRAAQPVFSETGGLHAAGLFDASGGLLLIREDVGRHNAVDKVIGAALMAGHLPRADRMLVVSGRVAYEIVQKAAMADLSIVVAVGAPSSLAVEAARATHMTLIGFARDGRFNVYTGWDRLPL